MDLKKIKLTVQRYSYRHFNKRTEVQISIWADWNEITFYNAKPGFK
jgi:hypothetical protein